MGGLRRSDLAALAWVDLEDQADGIAVHVRRSKTNQDGSGPDIRFVKNGSAKSIRELRRLRAESGSRSFSGSGTAKLRFRPSEGRSAKRLGRIAAESQRGRKC